MYCVLVNNSWAWKAADIHSVTQWKETYFPFLSLYRLQLAWLEVQLCCFTFSVTFVWFELMKVLCMLEKSLWVHTSILYKFCRFLAHSFVLLLLIIFSFILCPDHSFPSLPFPSTSSTSNLPFLWLFINPIF